MFLIDHLLMINDYWATEKSKFDISQHCKLKWAFEKNLSVSKSVSLPLHSYKVFSLRNSHYALWPIYL